MESKWQDTACTQRVKCPPLPKDKLASSMEPTGKSFMPWPCLEPCLGIGWRTARWTKLYQEHANDEKMGCHGTGLEVSPGLVSFIAVDVAPESSLHVSP